jgi:hypothetical protein
MRPGDWACSGSVLAGSSSIGTFSDSLLETSVVEGGMDAWPGGNAVIA